MKVFNDLNSWRWQQGKLSQPIGFVPTMGALHEGHISLFKRCRTENEVAVASIFINATQFDDPGDLSGYPKTLQQDLEKAEACGMDYILTPSFDQIYPDNYNFRVIENSLSSKLCGVYRLGHFEGVLTIVLKLFNLVRPQRAYFGEKDFQQYMLIKNMVDAFFLDIEVISCPTVRDEDGLALSSRNSRLKTEERRVAAQIYKKLTKADTPAQAQAELEALGFEVEYLEDYQSRRFVAAHLNGVRLIDNVKI